MVIRKKLGQSYMCMAGHFFVVEERESRGRFAKITKNFYKFCTFLSQNFEQVPPQKLSPNYCTAKVVLS